MINFISEKIIFLFFGKILGEKMEKVLEVKNIYFSYEKEEDLISNLSFDVEKNQFVSIVGSSGCGKSTIIKLISGIYENKSGEIIGKKTAYMPQKDLLLPWRTVLENIILPIELEKKDLKVGREKACGYLKRLGLLEYKDKYPYELSGGMKQRVSFIRTLLTEAEILLLDEPFSALDAITKENLQKWLLDVLKTFNKSVIFITHDINEALFLSDRILVCDKRPLTKLKEYKISVERKNDLKYMSFLKENILSDIGGGKY